MKIKSPKQFEAAVKELLECHRICNDAGGRSHALKESDRIDEIETALDQCPYTYDQNQSVVMEYRIHITPSYCFRFQSLLSWWQIFLIKLVGWKINPIKD